MKPTVIVLSNRKNLYLPQALTSLARNLRGHEPPIRIVDDSGDSSWRWDLEIDGYTVMPTGDRPVGYAQAMRCVWELARTLGTDVFFFEEDFTLDRPLDLADLRGILDQDATLTQVALQRQPWYENEKREGGVIAAIRVQGPTFEDRGSWIRHNAGFTGNPSLIARQTFEDFTWPDPPWSEAGISRAMRERGKRFAYYGQEKELYITHHGHQRAPSSTGY